MSDQPLLTMCLIARDEAHNIDRCFSSWWDAVDEVVLVDTGSKDDTINVAKAFAKSRGQARKLKISRFKWVDDFAAARQRADDLATTEWITWCDLDDTIEGLDQLRNLAADASTETVAFFCHYTYMRDGDGNVTSELWRERVVRRVPWRWTDRLHEHKLFTAGHIVKVDPAIARWEHHPLEGVKHGERNTRILERWDEDEANSPRVLSALGMEYMGLERTQDAVDTFRRFLAIPDQEQDRRAQASRYMAVNLLMLDEPREAMDLAWSSLTENWDWPDTHMTLAECCQTLGNPRRGYQHAKQALEMGKPDSLLILNPLQYTAHPLAVMAVCAAQMGMLGRAIELGEQTLRVSPSNALVNANLQNWRGALQRDQTIDSFLQLAKLNSECDELEKARTLLESVPFFIAEDTRVIDMRVAIRELIAKAPVGFVPEPESPAAKFLERHQADDRLTIAAPDGATQTGRLKVVRMMDVAEELQREGVIDEIGVTDEQVIVGAATRLKRPRRGTVAVWTGYAIGAWHPFDITARGLGGSETAAVRLAEELSNMGYAVSLYGQFDEEGVIGDVLLRDFRKFDPTRPLDVFIGFRNAERFNHPINADTTILWLEDLPGPERLSPHNLENIDYVCAVSHWHRQAVLDHYPWLDGDRVKACRNGITHAFFETEPTPEREKRVLYTSSPDRGAEIVLECWPRVLELVPDAQLIQTYSRWYDIVAEANPHAFRHRAYITSLLDQSGVKRISGGLGQAKLATLMRSSMVWVHPSWYADGNMEFHETSCISAMEAQAAGLVVVASNWGALTETVQHGTLLDGVPTEKDGTWRDAFVHAIVGGLTDEKTQAAAQTIGPELVRHMDWRGATEQLAALFKKPLRAVA